MKAVCRRKMSIMVLCLSLFVVFSLVVSEVSARSKKPMGDMDNIPSVQAIEGSLPNAQQRVHRIPDVQMCLTNWGFMGSQTRDLYESRGGCFNPNPDIEWPAPSFEYPSGSDLEYLFHGGLWIGARIDDNFYTSVGCDGWFWIYELWPEADWAGAINEASIRLNAPCYSPDAISEQDIMATYTDTSADIPLSPDDIDDWDNRKHFPLDVKVAQRSYSWNEEELNKFIIVEYIIHNIGIKIIRDMFIGLYVDADILHVDENPYGPFGAQDDITGFLRSYQYPSGESEEVNIAWAADNDGHGRAGEMTWTEFSPRSVMGVKILFPPHPQLQVSYNWWISHFAGYPKDWGPWIATNQDVWEMMNPYGSGNVFPDNVLGTPGGDVSKYFVMSNGEFDYDQAYACVWPDEHPEEGWLPHSPECDDLADGYDTRFLLSFGPFDELSPGDSLVLAVAYVIGESLHVDPLNSPNITDPDLYYSKLYFGDLVKNALMAEKTYHDIRFNDPPNPFSLVLPLNKAFTPLGVHFLWEAAGDPNMFDHVSYDLFVSTSYHFHPDSTTVDNDLTTNELAKALDYGVYYWKVKAKDNRGAERWCNQIRYFMVTGLPYSTLGDLNRDGYVDISDLVFAINYLYRTGPVPDPLELGDVNCDDKVDTGDVVYLINYLFRNGWPPNCKE
jgi:hypothetical protein